MTKRPKATERTFPNHGDPYVSPDDPTPEGSSSVDENPDDGTPPPPPAKTEVEVLRETVANLAGRLDAVQQELIVARNARQPDPPEEDDFYEKVDEKLFQSPKDVLKTMEERIVSKVSKELTSTYNKDQGERAFWNDFYAANPDLKADDDLVKATLQGNMSRLGGLPVSQAVTELAALTRDRISRYSKTPRQRPQVEGASPPSPKPDRSEPRKVVTLSDIIKNRKAKRRGQAA